MSGDERESLRGIVLEIQRMSTEDGPGIRTTVFFKGCTLACAWCHNPESLSPRPQVQWVGSKCIGCGTCLDTCPNGALSAAPDGISIDRELCEGCAACVEECPSTAMELLGKQWSLDDLTNEVVKDRAYFEKSGGGVSASGGEATMQAGFVAAFLKGLRQRGIHTAMDTSGQCTKTTLERLLPHVDLLLYDIKEIDPGRHKTFTGHSNERIVENLVHVRDFMRAHGSPGELWIRTPIIPDATAREENIRGIGAFIASRLDGAVSRWELCSFNNLCKDKYIRLGMDWAFKDKELMSSEAMETLAEAARQSGVDPGIVLWTGSTRIEEEEQGGGDHRPRLSVVNACNMGPRGSGGVS